MRYTSYRPKGHVGRLDAKLPAIVKDLRRLLAETERTLAYDTLRLEREELEELAGILVDFAVDIHNDIGIWNSYETYNVEWFGTPLPMTTDPDGVEPPVGIHPDRIGHLLWIVYPEFKPGLILAPRHQGLVRMADAAHEFLDERFSTLPRDTGVKKFLATPNQYGWDVKRKLVWLGTRSYMFRLFCQHYTAEQADGADAIDCIDEFVCQRCTRWSGLGVIDILARTLDIDDARRRDLRSWYERHWAGYKILSARTDVVEALNVVNEQRYVIRMDVEPQPFRTGQLVVGALVPWNGEWYWSGTQRAFDAATPEAIDDLRNDMIRRTPHIVCRYAKDYERRVRERTEELHAEMMRYSGKDLVVYPDGLSMAADWQKELRHHLSSKPQDEVQAALERHGITSGRPSMSVPEELLEHTDGIGVFLNPDEGKEIMPGFNLLVSGLRRKGNGLTEDEGDAIRGLIETEAISPRFVKRMVADHGHQSIKAAYMLPPDTRGRALEYLLRCHKGHFFRKRYPALSIV